MRKGRAEKRGEGRSEKGKKRERERDKSREEGRMGAEDDDVMRRALETAER